MFWEMWQVTELTLVTNTAEISDERLYDGPYTRRLYILQLYAIQQDNS